MSRLRAFILFAALLALASAFAACGGGSDSGSPEGLLEDATLQGVESADLDFVLTLVAKGNEGGRIDVSLSGPFQSEGKGQLPRLALDAKADGSLGGDDVDFEGGLVLLPNKAYVSYEGTDYEVDPTTFSFIKSSIEESQRREGEQSEDVTACQEAAGELEVGDFADNLVDEGSAKVGGTSTTKISGDLNVPGAIDSLVELANEPACEAQLDAAGSLALDDEEIEEAKSRVEGAVKRAHVEVDVGEDDIVRRIAAQLAIEPEDSGSGPDSVDLDFDLTLSGVNEGQPIVAPNNAKPLNDLFLKLGVNPIELLRLLEGQGGISGLGDLLDEIGGSGGSGSGSGSGQSYTECLQDARSAADIQKCSSKLR